jgi:hypothetical protein
MIATCRKKEAIIIGARAAAKKHYQKSKKGFWPQTGFTCLFAWL